ncbi:hypothetical protein PIB30_076936 [Stylosanthes scabra]|uniref:Bifunctional inhibitor/plant lipid transfer protein/seed storage helical domain-containing protein n=1 Tax=Stylosanthes scabra TaxID=79078 RepID=A0ABU6SR20_9FABA|nr:hypothetical protein [Stylosanthes scabra]
MAVSKLALIATIMACMVISGSHGQATLSCDQVTVWLLPCVSYAVLGGNVSQLCCQGIYSLNKGYKNGDDRRYACQCIKDRAALIPGINYKRVNQIDSLCGTKCPIKVYPNTNCSKVQ